MTQKVFIQNVKGVSSISNYPLLGALFTFLIEHEPGEQRYYAKDHLPMSEVLFIWNKRPRLQALGYIKRYKALRALDNGRILAEFEIVTNEPWRPKEVL